MIGCVITGVGDAIVSSRQDFEAALRAVKTRGEDMALIHFRLVVKDRRFRPLIRRTLAAYITPQGLRTADKVCRLFILLSYPYSFVLDTF